MDQEKKGSASRLGFTLENNFIKSTLKSNLDRDRDLDLDLGTDLGRGQSLENLDQDLKRNLRSTAFLKTTISPAARSFGSGSNIQERSRKKDSLIQELSKKPGLIYQIKRGKDELITGTSRQQRYDPYSFLDKMAMPFDVPRPSNGKMKKNNENLETSNSSSDMAVPKKAMPHCKACTDFKTWMELTANPRRDMSRQEREEKQCPLDSSLLGNNTWSFLHTMAAYYPEKPSAEQQHKMKKFINLLSDFYPCHKCAANLREDLKSNTPETSSNTALSRWFCELHNKVNVRLGKAEFDCTKVLERWRDGWADGTCD